MLNRIRKSFSTKLSLGILLMAVTIFVVSLGVLFTQSRHIIRTEAVGRTKAVLNTTMQHIVRNLMTIENATNTYSWMIEQQFQPEQILGCQVQPAYRRMLNQCRAQHVQEIRQIFLCLHRQGS